MLRSLNNNMFRYSNYWESWSRILFHDAQGRGMERMREKYNIPNRIETVGLLRYVSLRTRQH
jgi:hypothetical protein